MRITLNRGVWECAPALKVWWLVLSQSIHHIEVRYGNVHEGLQCECEEQASGATSVQGAAGRRGSTTQTTATGTNLSHLNYSSSRWIPFLLNFKLRPIHHGSQSRSFVFKVTQTEHQLVGKLIRPMHVTHANNSFYLNYSFSLYALFLDTHKNGRLANRHRDLLRGTMALTELLKWHQNPIMSTCLFSSSWDAPHHEMLFDLISFSLFFSFSNCFYILE